MAARNQSEQVSSSEITLGQLVDHETRGENATNPWGLKAQLVHEPRRFVERILASPLLDQLPAVLRDNKPGLWIAIAAEVLRLRAERDITTRSPESDRTPLHLDALRSDERTYVADNRFQDRRASLPDRGECTLLVEYAGLTPKETALMLDLQLDDVLTRLRAAARLMFR